MLHVQPNDSRDWGAGAGIGAGGLCKRPRSFEIRPVSIYRIYVIYRAPVNGMSVSRPASPSSVRGSRSDGVCNDLGFIVGRSPAGDTGRNGTRLSRNQRRQDTHRERERKKKKGAPTASTPPAATAITWQRRPDVDCCVMGAVLPGPGTVCTICATVGRAAPLFDHLRGTARTGVSWAGRGGTRTHVPKYRGIRPVAQMQSAT